MLAILFLSGLTLRICWLAEIQEHPDFQIPLLYQTDMGFIDNSALGHAQSLRSFFGLPELTPQFERHIVWRHNAGNPQLRPPGYTFLLAFLYFLFGDNQLLVRVVQMTLGLASGWLGYRAGRKMFGSRAGVITAGALWLYWPLILYESVLHEPVLMVFASLLLINSALNWLHGGKKIQAVLTGISCGIFTLASSQVILFLPVLILWMLWVARARLQYFRKALVHGALAGAAFFLPLLPVTALNYYESGLWVLNSHGHGITLYIANQPGATGFLMPGDPLLDQYLALEKSTLSVDEKTALIEDWVDWSRFSQKAAFKMIMEEPGDFIKRSLVRAVFFWSPYEISQNVLEYCDRLFSNTLSSMPGGFALVLPGMALGLFYFLVASREMMRSQQPLQALNKDSGFTGMLLILLFILVWYLPYLVLWASAHFRIPLLPSLFLLSSFGLLRFVEDVNKKQWRRCLTAGFCALCFLLPAGFAHWDYSDDIQTWLYYRTKLYQETERQDKALSLALRAAQGVPNHAFVHKSCADLLYAAGCEEEARVYYEKTLLCSQGEVDRNPVLENLGIIERNLKNNETAKEIFSELLEENPHHLTALHYLGNIAYEEGHYEEAVKYLTEACNEGINKGNTFFLLGLTLRALGQTEQAIEVLRQGHKLDPEDPWIILELADALIVLEERDEACHFYHQLLNDTGQYPRAKDAWKRYCTGSSNDDKKTLFTEEESPDPE
ncbi:MAG: tetratricopeptide repeat protein [Candidatus Hydrogenedens sp.]|nr:tetratricopeptide repeat protein [Candidatus Hydrogenedens sp.]